jgi:hypothetical protein
MDVGVYRSVSYSNWTIIPVHEVRFNGREVSVQGMLAHLVEVDVAQGE